MSRLNHHVAVADAILARLRASNPSRSEDRLDGYDREVLRQYRARTSPEQQFTDSINGDHPDDGWRLQDAGLSADPTLDELEQAWQRESQDPSATLRDILRRDGK